MILDKSKILSIINSKQAFVEVNRTGDDWKISFIITKLKKGSLIIESKQCNIHSLDELREKLSHNIPTHFIITGDGVLFRILRNTEQVEPKELISDAFSTLNLNDVFFEINKDGDNNYLSIIRKEKLNSTLNDLKESGFKPVSIKAGYSYVQLLGEYLDSSISSIITDGMNFHFEKGKLQSCNKTEELSSETYDIGGDSIESEYLNAFCLAMVGYTHNDYSSSSVDLVLLNQELIEDVFYVRLTNIGWKASVAILFLLLLINFFLFDHFNNKSNELTQQIYQIEKGRESKIKQEKQSFEDIRIYTEYGFLSNYYYSRYIDELSNSLIRGMHFVELELNPQVVNKTSKKLSFNAGLISIEGRNEKSIGIELFERKVKNKDWVLSTNLKKVSRKNNTSSVYFSLDVSYVK